jgi:thiamine transporter
MKRIFDEFIKGGNVDLYNKFVEKWWFIIILIGVIALIVVGTVLISKKLSKNKTEDIETARPAKKSKFSPRMLVTGAMCIGLAFILSYIKIWDMPLGGAITPASGLPIILFAYIYGWQPGLVVSFTYSILQILQAPNHIMSFPQALLDYVIAFTVLAVAGFFKKNKTIIPAVICAYVLRYLAHVLAGILWYQEYNETSFSGIPYCFIYNAVFLLPELIICIIIVVIPPMSKAIERLKKQYA